MTRVPVARSLARKFVHGATTFFNPGEPTSGGPVPFVGNLPVRFFDFY